jgi:hypothetical protein
MSYDGKKPYKVYIIRELLRDKNLTNIEALLHSKLMDLVRMRQKYAPNDGVICRPTNKYLGEILNLKPFTIQKYLKSLAEKGYIRFSSDFEFCDNLYYKHPFEFTESRTREIRLLKFATYRNIFEVKSEYLQKYKHKEAITYSYLDGVRKIPCYKIKKSTIADAMGVYNFQSILQRIKNYPNLDRIDGQFVYLKR